ncbi:MAG: alkaline phosphatase family protein [Deltaproteobacteria bacterium]
MDNKNFPIASAIRRAYKNNMEDETLLPHILVDDEGNAIGRISANDSVIFYNIRGEREIELTESLTVPNFNKFTTKRNLNLNFATMIEYSPKLPVAIAFPPVGAIEDTLCDILSKNGIKQVKITEAEKAVHVSFFLSGKKYSTLADEEFIIVPTRKDVAFFDEAPEMSIAEITQTTIAKINDNSVGFIFVNFPNADVLGHIENEQAILRALTTVDEHTGLLVDEAMQQEMDIIVSADHGSVEKWLYPDGAIDTGHTDSDVPFILISNDHRLCAEAGELIDIAPSVLALFGIDKPAVMTGENLIAPQITSSQETKRDNTKKRVLFILLDGWGWNDNQRGNLIAKADTPIMDKLMSKYAWAKLSASGESVGLLAGTVGNSEAGHLHIGAGRKIFSDRVHIDLSIADGSFFCNSAFISAMDNAIKNNSALHLLGIVSFFSSHGSINYLFALIDMAKSRGVQKLFVHAMLGRRGELPESGALYIQQVEQKLADMSLGSLVSVIGRYWSMDREENWDRIEKTYCMLVNGEQSVAVRKND